ncbi:MAG: HAD-IG family 5'-nucleotidase [Polyangiaceae bacterium]
MATIPADPLPRERGLFCNRTLNMRAIRAIGYDMDYTLVHYKIDVWENRAYEHLRARLVDLGWPVENLTFDPKGIVRGLIIDTELGNVVKANRFGYVKRAFHGTKPLAFEALRAAYAHTIVDLAEPRWVFLNTLFSLSEAYMFSQLVDLFDEGATPGVRSYREIYALTRKHIDLTHMEGELKREIVENPEKYVELDPDTALTLLDQRSAGKQLMLITNSEWPFTVEMMKYNFDRFLPTGMTWRDLFDLVIVAASKPTFFSSRAPFLEVASPDGLLRPIIGSLKKSAAYFGGNAVGVEQFLGLSGDEILYIGDHMFGDVHVTKGMLRWRTALIVRELEDEIAATLAAEPDVEELAGLMMEKESLERDACQWRLELTRLRAGYGEETASEAEITAAINVLRGRIASLDDRISPLAKRASEVGNPSWGPIMWAGNDKSHLARQIERYADVYTSRVSNFASATPFVYLRSPRGTLPHDHAPAPAAGSGAYALGGPRSSPRDSRPSEPGGEFSGGLD